MNLFYEDGHLRDEGLQALIAGALSERERLMCAEHLANCDGCLARYTALLSPDVLQEPARKMEQAVMQLIWVRLMNTVGGRVLVASFAAVIAVSLWLNGAFTIRPLPKVAFSHPMKKIVHRHEMADAQVSYHDGKILHWIEENFAELEVVLQDKNDTMK